MRGAGMWRSMPCRSSKILVHRVPIQRPLRDPDRRMLSPHAVGASHETDRAPCGLRVDLGRGHRGRRRARHVRGVAEAKAGGEMSGVEQIRSSIREILALLADTEQQSEYERNVPIADVPSELICMWFDDQYHPEDAMFHSSFSCAERQALAVFNADFAVAVDELKSLGIGWSVAWLHAQPAWARVVRGATSALGSLGE